MRVIGARISVRMAHREIGREAMQDLTEASPVSRREFLKMAGIAGAMLGAGATFAGLLAACGSGSTTTTAAATATSAAGGTATTASAATGSVGPLNNGRGDRTQIVVISDIHLGADISYAETNQNRSAGGLPRSGQGVTDRQGTGHRRRPLDEWFVPATTDTYAGGTRRTSSGGSPRPTTR